MAGIYTAFVAAVRRAIRAGDIDCGRNGRGGAGSGQYMQETAVSSQRCGQTGGDPCSLADVETFITTKYYQ